MAKSDSGYSFSDSSGYDDGGDSTWDIFGNFSNSDFSAGFESAFNSGGGGSDWGDGGATSLAKLSAQPYSANISFYSLESGSLSYLSSFLDD